METSLRFFKRVRSGISTLLLVDYSLQNEGEAARVQKLLVLMG
jgi:hypothetical protein